MWGRPRLGFFIDVVVVFPPKKGTKSIYIIWKERYWNVLRVIATEQEAGEEIEFFVENRTLIKDTRSSEVSSRIPWYLNRISVLSWKHICGVLTQEKTLVKISAWIGFKFVCWNVKICLRGCEGFPYIVLFKTEDLFQLRLTRICCILRL